MSDSPNKASTPKTMGGLMWLALGLFIAFFLNVAVQRFRPGLLDISAAQEAMLLVAATACFISACLRLESRQSSTP
ncbi:hypothetical protein L861_14200 [Litchfieldella anticariensis FP35 = DSM 16096]|uniref:Uncharacterized protein n=1 Tax=Litchfieldella anticariensis (strain DSM 16096 / CECT 5854 / CIP 108499 / LMG 22089 / FP35) TaxID=1121939 RepID=S2L6V8_LITA3|nr:hypothetical protein [Halomonas anticariensis]EPC00421.1 hypothetical protein L861_14200 [Halomonas anticariensis FP35 = DSM 16096]